VRLAAIRAAMRINRFTSVTSIVERIGDDSASVRRAAVSALGTMRQLDAAPQIAALVSVDNEDDAAVRKAAIWALATLGASESRDAIRAALDDPDRLVRDAARTALQRL
jgi:HEAT repeat protein